MLFVTLGPIAHLPTKNKIVMRLLFALLLPSLFACNRPAATTGAADSWQQSLGTAIPLLGHRNWVLVVDKAYPAQSAAGIDVVNTGKELPQVLAETLAQLKKATHVMPVVYQDRELASLNNALFPGVDSFKTAMQQQLAGYAVKHMLHDTVLARIGSTAADFKVLILKTETVIPYSSVFLELDCRYWGPEKERALRNAMAGDTTQQKQ